MIMFGSFLPSLWSSTNHSLLGSKEPTLLCNHLNPHGRLMRLPGATENFLGSPCRFCTFSFDVWVEQQLSSELERQPNSTRNKMRFMVIVKVTEDTENEGAPPDPQLMADLNKFNDELLEAGVLIGYDGLHPSSKGARVHFSGKNCT